jgi:hypothetical protein
LEHRHEIQQLLEQHFPPNSLGRRRDRSR